MKRMDLLILAMGLVLFSQLAQADWTPAQRLTWTPSHSHKADIAVDPSGHLHLVWYDLSYGAEEIYYKKSTNAGAAWSASQRLTWISGSSRDPAIASDSSGNLHLVWSDNTSGDYEIYYKKSTNGGAAWTANQRLTWSSGLSFFPDLAVDSSGHLHAVWKDDPIGVSEIYYKKSTDGGAAWTASQRLTWTSDSSEAPAVAVDSLDYLHVVWKDYTPGNFEIYYKKSTDGGVAWTTSQRLTWTLAYSNPPDIAVGSSDHLHVVWCHDKPENFEVYYKKSTDRGATWTASQRLTWTLGTSYTPVITVDSSGGIHVVWCDDTPGVNQVYYKMSADGGATWTASQRLAWTLGSSWDPAIGVDASGNLHVFWSDQAPGNYEVYYKKFSNE